MAMMPPGLRLSIQDSLRLSRQMYYPIKAIVVNVTVCPSCGYDAFTDGARVIPCVTCGGTGEIPTYVIYQLKARWIAPGVESGDLIVWVSPYDKETMLQVYRTKSSYLDIEGNTFMVGGYNPDGVGNPDEYSFIGKKYKPVHDYRV
jgi:hypothetical protein